MVRSSWGALLGLFALWVTQAHGQAAKPEAARLDQYGDPLPAGAIARIGSSRLLALPGQLARKAN